MHCLGSLASGSHEQIYVYPILNGELGVVNSSMLLVRDSELKHKYSKFVIERGL